MFCLKFLWLSTCAMYFVSGQYQVITDHAQCPTLKCCDEMKIMMSTNVDNRTRQALELKNNLIGQITELKENFSNLKENFTSLRQQLLTEVKDILTGKMCEMKDILLGMSSIAKSSGFVTAKNCAELFKSGIEQGGVYEIKDGIKNVLVRCDMTTDGGGWTVFQRRIDGAVDFIRGWDDYKNGFGDAKGEYWLGLDKIYELTRYPSHNTLRIDMEDFRGEKGYAIYDYFAVLSERNNYTLSLGKYSGNAGESLSYNRGQAFATKDKDNDEDASGNCAVNNTGAWWYKYCAYSNLNGVYDRGVGSPSEKGVFWYHWKGRGYSLKKTEMKIRPSDFLK